MTSSKDIAIAKRKLSAAAQACLEKRPDAADAADEAKAQLDVLQNPQRTHLCAADQCQVSSISMYCWKHKHLATAANDPSEKGVAR